MILIISKSKKQALAISDAMFYMGHLSVGATPTEALSEISFMYRAAVIVEPDTFPDIKEYISRLKSYLKTVPIFALGAQKNTDAFDKVLKLHCSTPRLISEIYEYTYENSLAVPGTYKLGGFDLSSYLPKPKYFNTELPFSRTELMILRTLIRHYPLPIKAEKMLKYAFRQSKQPSPANIRTHSSIINKKFKLISGRNAIEMVKGKGYIILTPEIANKFSEENI